jgi:hypothetical protein
VGLSPMPPQHWLPGPAFFYGVDESNIGIWRQVRSDPKREWYYCDNAYFDSTRQEYFRVTKNRIQHSGYGSSDISRFLSLGIDVHPWQNNVDGHVVVCPQSEPFMRNVIGFNGDWRNEVVTVLKQNMPGREIRVREWNRDKTALAATLGDDLGGAYALVTFSSAAAVTAVLTGVPIVCGASCAAMPMSGHLFQMTNMPRRPRETWAGVLADNQWTLNEFRDGTTWRMLHG